MHTKVLAILAMAGMLAVSAGAQQVGCTREPISNTHRVLKVTDANGAPVGYADVIDLINKSTFGITTKDGSIALAGVRSQNDSAVVAVRKIGYTEARFIVTVGCEDTAAFVQKMDRLAQQLPAVSVKAPALSNMVFRAMAGAGEYIDNNELHAPENANKTLEDLLEEHHISQELATGKGSNPRGQSSFLGKKGCYVRILIDNSTLAHADVSLPASYFGGVEFYPSALLTPAELADPSNGSCGTLAIWTRDPH